MHNQLFLVCLKNPFRKEPLLFCFDNQSYFFSEDINIINRYNLVISYRIEDSIYSFIINKKNILTEIVDIVTLKKLLVGRPKKEFKQNKEPWTLRNIIGQKVSKNVFSWLKDIFEMKLIHPEKVDNFQALLKELLDGFVESYNELLIQLKKNDEYDRFFEIEVPVWAHK